MKQTFQQALDGLFRDGVYITRIANQLSRFTNDINNLFPNIQRVTITPKEALVEIYNLKDRLLGRYKKAKIGLYTVNSGRLHIIALNYSGDIGWDIRFYFDPT